VQPNKQFVPLEPYDAPASDAVLKRFFDVSPDLLCIFDVDGILRRTNPAFTDSLGWATDDLLSRPLLDFIHPDDRAQTREMFADRATTGEANSGEYRWRCADGSYRWLAWKWSRADEDGVIYGVARDVTQNRRAKSELRALHDYAAVGITMASPDGRFLKANPAFCEMIGYSEPELLEMTSVDLTLPDDRPEQTEYLRRMVLGETRCHVVEKRYLRKDGDTMWGRVMISVIRDATGAIEAFVAVVEDITEARHTATALRESEARCSRIASNVPGMVYQSRRAADGTTSFPFVSDGVADIYGITAGELQAKPRLVFDVVHPEDRARFDESMETAHDQRAPWRWAGRIVVNGAVKWVEGGARPQQHQDGSTIWDGLMLDVTEARRAALRLEESETRYRSLFEYHPDAVFSLDPEGRFQSANPGCEILSGYSPDEMLGRPFDSLVAPDQLAKAYGQFEQALKGIATNSELILNQKSGRHVEINVTNVPVRVAGEVVGVFGIARDLTKQRELEAQLRHAQKMEAVGQLAAGVAHDFNNVLTVIQGCSEFLRASLPEGDESREDVEMIRDAALRASVLTRQLLAFSRKQVLQLSTVDLNACITDLQRIVGKMMGEDITLTTDLGEDLGYILADASQLEQVIVNMTVNARDAMPNGGELRMSTRNCIVDEDHVRKHPGAAAGPHVCLSIEDNGCGMDQDTLSRIFEPFFTTKEAGKGTGLGLATAYGIIRQSAGHIVARSIPGVGTAFEIYLPLSEAAPVSSTSTQAKQTFAPRTETPLGSSGTSASAPGVPITTRVGEETILLVEDDAQVRSLASQILLKNGYVVIEAENGADAMQRVRSCGGRVDLVVTDAMMPVMNGGELAEALAQEFPNMKVLFMSLFTGDSIVRRGADERRAFLPKPFSTDDLVRKVRDVLATPGPTA
jgi:PAS domain S-box-containing protein